VLLLLLVPAVFAFPYKNLGARDAEGNRFYRAYFTADFIWHMALTAELTKYSMPQSIHTSATAPFSTTGRISSCPRSSAKKASADCARSKIR
jgi:hypothetical protein